MLLVSVADVRLNAAELALGQAAVCRLFLAFFLVGRESRRPMGLNAGLYFMFLFGFCFLLFLFLGGRKPNVESNDSAVL